MSLFNKWLPLLCCILWISVDFMAWVRHFLSTWQKESNVEIFFPVPACSSTPQSCLPPISSFKNTDSVRPVSRCCCTDISELKCLEKDKGLKVNKSKSVTLQRINVHYIFYNRFPSSFRCTLHPLHGVFCQWWPLDIDWRAFSNCCLTVKHTLNQIWQQLLRLTLKGLF